MTTRRLSDHSAEAGGDALRGRGRSSRRGTVGHRLQHAQPRIGHGQHRPGDERGHGSEPRVASTASSAPRSPPRTTASRSGRARRARRRRCRRRARTRAWPGSRDAGRSAAATTRRPSSSPARSSTRPSRRGVPRRRTPRPRRRAGAPAAPRRGAPAARARAPPRAAARVARIVPSGPNGTVIQACAPSAP